MNRNYEEGKQRENREREMRFDGSSGTYLKRHPARLEATRCVSDKARLKRGKREKEREIGKRAGETRQGRG